MICRLGRESYLMRLCITVGPWQTVVLECALRMHINAGGAESAGVLCFNAKGAHELLYREVAQLSETLREWDRVEWVQGSLRDLSCAVIGGLDFSVSLNRNRVTELWLPKFGPEEGRMARQFPRAKVFVYEDGAYAYSQGIRGYAGLRLLSKLKRCFWQLLPSALVRRFYCCEAYYGFLNGALKLPSYYKGFDSRLIDVFLLKELSQQLLGQGHVMPPELMDDRSVVFIGQCFSSLGQMSRSGEFSQYLAAVQRVLDQGGRVLWKEHPRNLEGFYQDIQAQLGSDNFLDFDELFQSNLPFDVVVCGMKLKGIVSVSSTALLMGKFVHNLSVARVDCHKINGANSVADNLVSLIKANVPQI